MVWAAVPVRLTILVPGSTVWLEPNVHAPVQVHWEVWRLMLQGLLYAAPVYETIETTELPKLATKVLDALDPIDKAAAEKA